MGRSVNYHSQAQEKLYLHYEYPTGTVIDGDGNETEEEFDDFDGSYWEDYVDYIIETLQEIAPSLTRSKDNEWQGNEVKKIAENNLCSVWISEYFGLVSLSFVPIEDSYYSSNKKEGLATHWIDQVFEKIKNKFISQKSEVLNKIGNFSNGEGVFELAK